MEYLHVGKTMYYGLESGEKTLNQEYLEILSSFYGVTIDYLVGRVKSPQGYLLTSDCLPKELHDIDTEMVDLIRDANNSGITKEDIKEIIEYRKYQKTLKHSNPE